MLSRIGTALGLALLCAVSIIRVARPPGVVPAGAPDTVFSAQRALHHVEQIAQRPHPMGSADHDRVRDYIVSELATLGIRAQIQRTTAIGTRYQEAGRVQNIVAWLPGADTKGRALLVVAHYDGVGAGPAAADDAAGSAAILETLRALRASKSPLAHDVVALFTDGEEAGLLGAAAFVREHPWAKDVAMVLNFEARGTTGRSVMFETGAGNLDAARALRGAGNASAGSVYATIYRTLPNDTDLSELAVLGVPAMNFAFADGVERYHTTRDDVAHLSPGSLQHHGSQMLALTREIGNAPLPRPTTGDAVFFDLPVLGLIVYPVGLELPLAIVALILVVVVVKGDRRPKGMSPVVAGLIGPIAAVVASALLGLGVGFILRGPGVWNGYNAAGIALAAVAVTLGCHSAARRFAGPGIQAGTFVIWSAIAGIAALRAPGVAYLFEWPLLFAAGACLLEQRRGRQSAFAEWLSAGVTLLMLSGFIYGVSVIMLGVSVPGAIALAVVTSMITLLLVPRIELVAGHARFAGAHWFAVASAAILLLAGLAVKPSADHPSRTALVYAENADSADAWLGSPGGTSNAWTRQVINPQMPAPAWTTRLGSTNPFIARRVQRVPLASPMATLARDTVINGARRVVLRVAAPPGTTALAMRARGAHVITSSIDGRIVDTTRYRYHPAEWRMNYWAVPDSGAIVALSIPIGAHIEFELVASRPGLPIVPGLIVPPRPENVVPSQSGDVNVVYRRWVF